MISNPKIFLSLFNSEVIVVFEMFYIQEYYVDKNLSLV